MVKRGSGAIVIGIVSGSRSASFRKSIKINST